MNSLTNEQLQFAVLLKCALAAQLATEEKSLFDLEEAFVAGDREKIASLTKIAEGDGLMKNIVGLKNLLTGLGEIGFGSAALYGALGGAGLYGGYRGLQDSAKRQQQADLVKQRVDLARRELETQQQAA